MQEPLHPRPTVSAGGRAVATVRIAKIYSTRDAVVQVVELEVIGAGPLFLAGRTMTSRDRHGRVQSFTLGQPLFPNVSRLFMLGNAWMEPMSAQNEWGTFADLAMPAGFLAVDGGVLSIEHGRGRVRAPSGQRLAGARARRQSDGRVFRSLGHVLQGHERRHRVLPRRARPLLHDRPCRGDRASQVRRDPRLAGDGQGALRGQSHLLRRLLSSLPLPAAARKRVFALLQRLGG